MHASDPFTLAITAVFRIVPQNQERDVRKAQTAYKIITQVQERNV